MEQTNEARKITGAGLARLAGSVMLAAAILIGCGMLAKSFSDNYYSSGGSSFPSDFTARIDDIGSDYIGEQEAMRYVGLPNWAEAVELWQSLLESGELDGAFVTFDLPVTDDEKEPGVIRVFSKTKLDAWMTGQFERQDGGVR